MIALSFGLDSFEQFGVRSFKLVAQISLFASRASGYISNRFRNFLVAGS